MAAWFKSPVSQQALIYLQEQAGFDFRTAFNLVDEAEYNEGDSGVIKLMKNYGYTPGVQKAEGGIISLYKYGGLI